MSSHRSLLSVRFKIFEKFCVVLSNTCIWSWLHISSGSLQKWCSCVCFVCLCCACWGGGSYLRNPSFHPPPPQKKWNNCCLLRVRKDFGNSLNIRKNDWLREGLENWKCSSPQTFFGEWHMRHFLTNLFLSKTVSAPEDFLRQFFLYIGPKKKEK